MTYRRRGLFEYLCSRCKKKRVTLREEVAEGLVCPTCLREKARHDPGQQTLYD